MMTAAPQTDAEIKLEQMIRPKGVSNPNSKYIPWWSISVVASTSIRNGHISIAIIRDAATAVFRSKPDTSMCIAVAAAPMSNIESAGSHNQAYA